MNLEILRLLSINDFNVEKVFIMVFVLKKCKMSIIFKLLVIVCLDYRLCEFEILWEIICCNLLIDVVFVLFKWLYEFYI